ncbi:X-ray repair cross-complementing protein 6 [Plecturocebus cupreus]
MKKQKDKERALKQVETKYSGRDRFFWATFESQSEDEWTPFDMSIQCIQTVHISKIMGSDRDLLAVVSYGSEKDKNSVNFKHGYVLQELDGPGAKRILELNQCKGQRNKGVSTSCWAADLTVHSVKCRGDVQFKMSHKRIMLFTSEGNPHGNDGAKTSQARTKAGDLQETGIFLDLMHLKKPGGFDISLFYRDTISTAEDEDFRVHFEESSKLEDLLLKVRAKETRKRALSRLKLKLSKDAKAVKPPPIKVYRETNEPVKTKTRTFNTSTGDLLLPSGAKRSQIYGSHQIILEKEEIEELKWFDDPGLMLMGFKPLVMLNKHHYLRPSLFVYPEESQVIGSSTPFSALLLKCLEKEVTTLCRYTPWRTSHLILWIWCHRMRSFQLVFLPFADDKKRKMPLTEKIMATPEQRDKMKAVVEKLCFTHRSHSFENPVLQQPFRNLEALALDLMEPEQAVDLTLPKVVKQSIKDWAPWWMHLRSLFTHQITILKGKLPRENTKQNSQDGVFRRGAEDPHQQGHAGQVHCAHAERGLLGIQAEEWAEEQELLKALTKHLQD